MSSRERILEQIIKIESYIHEDNDPYLKKMYEEHLRYLREKLRSDKND